MPQLGEICRAKDIRGEREMSVDRAKYIWSACELCEKERWVYLRKGKAVSSKCKHCSDKLNVMVALKAQMAKPREWTANRHYLTDGYVSIKVHPKDFFYPMANKHSYVLEHRLVVARALRRCLLPWETVHHKEGFAKDDNRYPETLELLPNPHKHDALTKMTNHIRKLEKRIKELELCVSK